MTESVKTNHSETNATASTAIKPGSSRVSANGTFTNPFLWADVPDLDVIRVGDVYYMTSTTMYFSPGCPVMKSYDLVNWEIVNYVYDILDDSDATSLRNGASAYGKGSWASSLRLHNGIFYVVMASFTTDKTYIFQTADIENGPWRRYTLDGVYHDMSLLFDDDGRVYLIYGGGTIRIIELNAEATAIKQDGLNKVIIEKANVGGNGGLPAEGSHFYKYNGKYYIFLIAWPPTGFGRRIELCYRADVVDGPYEGRVVLDDDMGFFNNGVAQGGIVDTPDGKWYAMLFQDHLSVGRIPVLVPVTWEDGWPVFGTEGRIPLEMTLPAKGCAITSIVSSDEFDRICPHKNYAAVNDDSYRSRYILENTPNDSDLALQWQWNHNPDNRLWSLTERPGYLRLKTGSLSHNIIDARNTLTQRTFGPKCSGSIAADLSGMKDGDVAGLGALQELYGYVGVKIDGNDKYIIMVNAVDGAREVESIPLTHESIYLKVDFDFTGITDEARFYYSLDGINWNAIGNVLSMKYLLSHFVGYRFALFYFATKTVGGHADFDFFRISGE